MNSLNDIVRDQIERRLEGFCDYDDVEFTDVLIGTYEVLDPDGYIETKALDSVIGQMYEDMLRNVIEQHNETLLEQQDWEQTKKTLTRRR